MIDTLDRQTDCVVVNMVAVDRSWMRRRMMNDIHHGNSFGRYIKQTTSWIVLLCVVLGLPLVGWMLSSSTTTKDAAPYLGSSSSTTEGGSVAEGIEEFHELKSNKTCSLTERDGIWFQFPPSKPCRRNIQENQCSITLATKCVDSSNWLSVLYNDDQGNSRESFVVIDVGCHMGLDSVHYWRVASRDSRVPTASQWMQEMERTILSREQAKDEEVEKKKQVQQGELPHYCPLDQLDAVPTPKNLPVRNTNVYCIEPVRSTIQAMESVLQGMKQQQNHIHFVNAALSNKQGAIPFPSIPAGISNSHLMSCPDDQQRKPDCESVPLYTLDAFVEKHVKHKDDDGDDKALVQILKIGVEGYDYRVLTGAAATLHRTRYLEFEYHHRGDWTPALFAKAIEDLRTQHGFVCYWAGQQRLWRITNCWMNHYQSPSILAHVACVNQRLAPQLHRRMERVFHETIQPNIIEVPPEYANQMPPASNYRETPTRRKKGKKR